jgi:hypothetical protein
MSGLVEAASGVVPPRRAPSWRPNSRKAVLSTEVNVGGIASAAGAGGNGTMFSG